MVATVPAAIVLRGRRITPVGSILRVGGERGGDERHRGSNEEREAFHVIRPSGIDPR
jgi:hypothetical protein